MQTYSPLPIIRRHLWPFLAGALLTVALVQSYRAYHWKQIADLRGWYAEQSYQYLTQPVATYDGAPVTRAQVLDGLTQSALKHVQPK